MNSICAWADWTEVADWVMNKKCLTLISFFGCFHLLQTSWWFFWNLLFSSDSLGNYGVSCLSVLLWKRKIKMLHCCLIQVDLNSRYEQSRLFFSKGMTPGLYLHLPPSEIFQRNLFPRKSFVHSGFPCEHCAAEIVQGMQGCCLPGRVEDNKEFRNKRQQPEFLS